MSDVLALLVTSLALVPMGGVLVKGSLLLGLGFVVTALSVRGSASGRHMVWASVLAALILLPVLEVAMPSRELAWLPAATREALPQPSGHGIVANPVARPDEVVPPRSETSASVGSNVGSGNAALRSWSWRRVVLVLWSGVALAWLASLGTALGRLSWLCRRAGDATVHVGWRHTLNELTNRFAIRRPIRVLVHPGVRVPLTWGFLRPVILLPADAPSYSAAERHDVLAHELAHVERLDWPVRMLCQVACALYWFHPLVWLAASRLSLEAERACDDRVLVLGSKAAPYAERLLGMARRARRRASCAPSAAVAMARPGELHQRIAAILNPTLRRTTVKPTQILTASLLAFGLVVILAPTRLVRAEAPLSTPSANQSVERWIGDDATPLIEASARGDLSAVRRLIDAGADVNGKVPGQGTPLILAATTGQTEVVRLLLESGADPRLAETSGPRPTGIARSALNAAARGGHEAIVRRLLDAGAQVDFAPRGDATPLMAASRHGHLGVVELLIDHRADADIAVSGDGSPLISAARGGQSDVVRRLLDAGADPNRAVPGDGNPLLMAARAGDVESVRLLLDAGADPNGAVRGDGNALMAAVRGGHREVVDLLVAAGADPASGVRGDGNALISAARRGDYDLVEALLATGADPDAAVRGDGNALIMAARGGHEDVVELLLDQGADVDRVVPGDENALIQAASRGHLDTVRLLLDRGADVNKSVVANSSVFSRGEKRSPLAMALRGGHDDVVELLRRHGAVE